MVINGWKINGNNGESQSCFKKTTVSSYISRIQ